MDYALFSAITEAISALAAMLTVIIAFAVANRYVFKKSYFGAEAEEKFESLKSNFCANSPKEISFKGGATKIFPNLVMEKKWWRIMKVTYYIEDDNGEKVVRTWTKKSSNDS